MTYRVTAGYVTAETTINERGSRAQVDIPRGADLPEDVLAEQVATLLRLGRIEAVEAERDRGKPLGRRTVAELQAHAAEHGIDLGGASKKSEMLAVIRAAGDAA